jgi:transposase
MKYDWFIGIDVSKNTLDFNLSRHADFLLHLQVENTKKGITSFLSLCKKHNVDFKRALFCFEYTGIYNDSLVKVLSEKKMNIWVEQGLQIKKSLGMTRGKSDKVDASRISEYAFRFQDKCRLWQAPSQALKMLKQLVSLRNRLIKARKLMKVPVGEFAECSSDKKSVSLMTKLNKPVVDSLTKQLAAVEEQIHQLIKDDERLFELEEIVTSVAGVGPVTAWAMIISTNQFESIQDGRKFACYAGVVPFDHQSGTSIKGRPRLSPFANKKMKQLLHLSALSATVMKGELNDYYNRKVAEGKSKMLVLNNIRNKLVLRVFACVKQNRKYENSYTHQLA